MLPSLKPLLLSGVALAASLIAAAPVAAAELSAAELRALRYYVEQGDRRSEAEIRRLRGLHPDWTPPVNLEALRSMTEAKAGPGEEENRVWKLIEVGNWTAASGRLAHLRATYPDWEPPAEMVRLIAMGEAQSKFDAAVTSGDAATAIQVARTSPAILRCDRVNNAWQLATMQKKVGDTQGALTTYRGVLGSCGDGSIVVATLEKANEVATDGQLAALADAARQSHPGLRASVEAVETRLMAGRGGATTSAQPRTAAAPAPQTQVQSQPQAPTPAPVAVATPARAVAPSNLPATGDGRVSAVRAAARAGNWTGCLAGSTNPRSVDLLYERAWCAMNRDRSLEALAAFRVASTAPLGAVVQRDARFGMALAFLENQMTEDAARIASVTNLTEKQRIEVETIILDQRGVRAYQKDDYRGAINYLNALEKLNGSIRRDLAILRAYAYLNAGERTVARDEFQRLHDQLATNETRKGLNAAMR